MTDSSIPQSTPLAWLLAIAQLDDEGRPTREDLEILSGDSEEVGSRLDTMVEEFAGEAPEESVSAVRQQAHTLLLAAGVPCSYAIYSPVDVKRWPHHRKCGRTDVHVHEW